MLKSDFYYELPEERIAQTPLNNRADSRLMLLDKSTGRTGHSHFRYIIDYLNAGDCLVMNDTKVIPARLLGRRRDTGGKVEVLLLRKKDEKTWEALVKPGRKVQPGCALVFGGDVLNAVVTETGGSGKRVIQFEFQGVFEEVLNELGEMPLPHYIKEKPADKGRYQTVYAKHEGSVAAPTAGLHFTEELLTEIVRKGVHIARLTLHVGLGTFRPVKVDNVEEHDMHAEWYAVPAQSAETINNARQKGGKIVAVGTTSCRTLESVADAQGVIHPREGFTDIFITPGYCFKGTDALITNFHLPESTLIMLVSALAGRENVLRAYEEAVKEQYRFFSFGDAMLIL